MNIAFFETEPWEQEYFEAALPDHHLAFYPWPLSGNDAENLKRTDIVSTFIYSQCTASVLSQIPNLRLITTRSTGVDHIDRPYCDESGIRIANVPSYGEHTVAEHAFALLLSLTHAIVPSVERTRRGDFTIDGLRGRQLFGKTVGIVGDGMIGQAFAGIARGFGMRVLVYARHQDKRRAARMGFSYAALPQLYDESDVISLHIPYTPETHHFVDREAFKSMKKGVILINTARGGIVDTESLVWALEQGIVSAVGTDVLEGERTLKEERQLLSKNFINAIDVKTQLLNHILIQKPTVIVTPHSAFNSQEALETILAMTVENISTFLKTGRPQHHVT
jgi:D-lactate dehydrogenase